MARLDMIESHLETLLERISGEDRVRRNSDGDWPFSMDGDAVLFVSLKDGDPPRVELRAHVSTDFPKSLRILVDTAVLNCTALYCRVCLYDGELVVVESDLVATDLDQGELQTSFTAVYIMMESIQEDYVLEWMAGDGA